MTERMLTWWRLLVDLYGKGDPVKFLETADRVLPDQVPAVHSLAGLDLLLHESIPDHLRQLSNLSGGSGEIPVGFTGKAGGEWQVDLFIGSFKRFLSNVRNRSVNLGKSNTQLNDEIRIWLEFTDTRTEFRLNLRAAFWRLLAGTVSGPSSGWLWQMKEKVLPRILPFLQLATGLWNRKPDSVQPSEFSMKHPDRESRTDLQMKLERAIQDIFFRDLVVIEVDVHRSSLDEKRKKLLRSLLITHVREKPEIGYVQSMSYVAAHLIRVFTPDPVLPVPNGRTVVDVFHGQKLSFYDIYSVFERIVDEQQTLWVSLNPATGTISPSAESFIPECDRIFDLLRVYDTALADLFATSIEMEEKVVLFQPWLDTLFSDSHLPVNEISQIWDFLFSGFCSEPNFTLRLRYYCAAVLIAHRDRFLNLATERAVPPFIAAPSLPFDEIAVIVKTELTEQTNRDRKSVDLILRLTQNMLDRRPSLDRNWSREDWEHNVLYRL